MTKYLWDILENIIMIIYIQYNNDYYIRNVSLGANALPHRGRGVGEET
jgi:hypothetical protein